MAFSCPSARHETELPFSYACLLPQSSADYSFPNLHGMRYHLDASVIPTILDIPLLFEDWYNHTVPPFLLTFSIPLTFSPARKYSGADPTTYLHFLLPRSSRPPLEFHLVSPPFHFAAFVWHSIAKDCPRFVFV